jgi:asparaginyl-tRNA synthetase
LTNIQVIIDEKAAGFDELKLIHTGAAVAVGGKLVESPGKGQKWEVHATDLQLVGAADPKPINAEKTTFR